MTVPFTQVPNAATRELSMDCLGLYTLLLSYRSASTGQCNPSRKTLLERTGWSESTLLRRMNTLVAKGYVARMRSGQHDAWQYAFPSLDPSPMKSLPIPDPSPMKSLDPRPFTHEESDGPDPSPQTARPFTRDAHIKEEQDVLEQEVTNARADGVLSLSVPQNIPDVLWRVLGMRQENNNNRARMAQLWPLLAEPLKRLRLDVEDRGQHKEIRALASNLEQLRRSVEVPLADLVRWQHWELGDPYWDQPDAVTYNPVRRHERSWGRWKRQGSPDVYATTPSARPGQGYGPSGRLNHEGRDPTLIGSGNVRWAQSPTEEDTNVYDAEHPRKILL